MLSVCRIVGDVNVFSLNIDSLGFLHLCRRLLPPGEAALSLRACPLPQRAVTQGFSAL